MAIDVQNGRRLLVGPDAVADEPQLAVILGDDSTAAGIDGAQNLQL